MNNSTWTSFSLTLLPEEESLIWQRKRPITSSEHGFNYNLYQMGYFFIYVYSVSSQFFFELSRLIVLLSSCHFYPIFQFQITLF
jgi:hypothetical protein